MSWSKLGQIYKVESIHPKLLSHAANPLPVPLSGDIFRVFFSGRDDSNRSSIGYVDIDIVKREVLYLHDSPVFEFGEEMTFYSHGVSIGNWYRAADGICYILFMGWHCPPDGHWRGEIGRLRLTDSLDVELVEQEPFLGLDDVDPVSLSYPWVMRHEGLYRMWYGSTIEWDAGNGEMVHVIKHAVSVDGHQWERKGVAVPYEVGLAQAFSRPTVIEEIDGGLSMWFSYRSGSGESYRIGYARSSDGDKWELALDKAGIGVAKAGWDSNMIEYPFVLQHADKKYMFYNGNDFGRYGFGLAVKEQSSDTPY